MIYPSHTKKKVLIAPLDWGLGHATRCVPVIRAFLERDCEVTVATSGSALALLRSSFPRLKFHTLVSYRARYSRTIPFMLHVAWQLPKFLWAIATEHRQLQRIVNEEAIDLIVSDNRYGTWSRTVPTVFITHQVNILMPPYLKWLTPAIKYLHHQQIRKFGRCWVPDWPGSKLTGALTQGDSIPLKFIGPLSRLKKRPASSSQHVAVIALLSGPEPQRTVFENLALHQLTQSGLTYLVVRGLPGSTQKESQQVVNHLDDETLASKIGAAELVICRSGYSSIMDLMTLEAKAVFVPTPGQTEQEYLAQELEKRGVACYLRQQEFNLEVARAQSMNYKGFAGWHFDSNLLAETIDELLRTLK